MGLVPKHEFIRISTKSHVLLMIKLSSTRSGVRLLNIGLLTCHVGWGRPS